MRNVSNIADDFDKVYHPSKNNVERHVQMHDHARNNVYFNCEGS